tara:strand:+ start:50314 stop:50502 length:189 start_codon:yes stop_codon:yes gene_type:complete
MNNKKYKRKKNDNKRIEILNTIKNKIPKIIFKAKNIVVTLKSKGQLKKWLKIYPEGKYHINQ